MIVEQVSKSRFKARALEYLRRVQETGQPVVILDRGRPAVKVVPYVGDAHEILRVFRGSVRLPAFPSPDPADRIIVATALGLGATLVTADRRIHGYSRVRTVW
jgi:prevent-host-death family protein